MAFSRDGYTLHSVEAELKGGRKQTIYFFAKSTPKRGEPCDLPAGYEVAQARTGMPVLRRLRGM